MRLFQWRCPQATMTIPRQLQQRVQPLLNHRLTAKWRVAKKPTAPTEWITTEIAP